jgi:hypothetical protein
MHTSAEPARQLPPGWEEVLTRVGQALTAAEADAARREQALQASAPAPTAGAGVAPGLERFRQRVRGLAECAGQADGLVAETLAALAGAEDALRAWLQAAEATRRMLATWASRA